jgi:hypothetical protein
MMGVCDRFNHCMVDLTIAQKYYLFLIVVAIRMNEKNYDVW